jgi:hypothetical protein
MQCFESLAGLKMQTESAGRGQVIVDGVCNAQKMINFAF